MGALLPALKRRQHSIAVQAVTGLINSSLENFFLSALKPWKALTEVLHVLRLHADRRQGLSTDRQARDGVRKEKERLAAVGSSEEPIEEPSGLQAALRLPAA